MLTDHVYSVLIDSGATHSVLSMKMVEKYSLQTKCLPDPISLIVFNPESKPSQLITHSVKWWFHLPSYPTFEWELLVVNTPPTEDIILGFDFLQKWNPEINRYQGTITPP